MAVQVCHLLVFLEDIAVFTIQPRFLVEKRSVVDFKLKYCPDEHLNSTNEGGCIGGIFPLYCLTLNKRVILEIRI